MKYILNAMKVTTQNRSSSLIIYMIFQTADLDPKLQTWADLVSKLQYAPTYYSIYYYNDNSNSYNYHYNIRTGVDQKSR